MLAALRHCDLSSHVCAVGGRGGGGIAQWVACDTVECPLPSAIPETLGTSHAQGHPYVYESYCDTIRI